MLEDCRVARYEELDMVFYPSPFASSRGAAAKLFEPVHFFLNFFTKNCEPSVMHIQIISRENARVKYRASESVNQCTYLANFRKCRIGVQHTLSDNLTPGPCLVLIPKWKDSESDGL